MVKRTTIKKKNNLRQLDDIENQWIYPKIDEIHRFLWKNQRLVIRYSNTDKRLYFPISKNTFKQLMDANSIVEQELLFKTTIYSKPTDDAKQMVDEPYTKRKIHNLFRVLSCLNPIPPPRQRSFEENTIEIADAILNCPPNLIVELDEEFDNTNLFEESKFSKRYTLSDFVLIKEFIEGVPQPLEIFGVRGDEKETIKDSTLYE